MLWGGNTKHVLKTTILLLLVPLLGPISLGRVIETRRTSSLPSSARRWYPPVRMRMSSLSNSPLSS